jgi:hypothetical protein
MTMNLMPCTSSSAAVTSGTSVRLIALASDPAARRGIFEIPLTEAGRRYFQERAAARELAYFVRSGPRRTARKRMRKGASAPPAQRLTDPSRPHIAVLSSGDRFTASLTAPTGRRFFVEIVRGSVGRTNAKRLAAAYLK